MTADPHRKAFNVLYEERSARIEKNLHNGQPGSAVKDRLCLGCHVHPELGPSGSALDLTADYVHDGVSCEGCHGASAQWRTEHYLAGWQQQSDEEKQRLGMNPTRNLLARAEMCTGCHVGSGDRDVNHDLIAAGHPRLNFEYSAYLAILPKHWDVRAEKRRYPDLEARAWVIGQVTSARAALELLAYRADADRPAAKGLSKAWPEFAEYNCFACHHDLQGKSWRQERRYPGRRPGAFAWGTWYFALLPQTLATHQFREQVQVAAALQQLRTEMQQPLPNNTQVAGQARELARMLKPCATELARAPSADRAFLQKTLKRLAADPDHLAAADWDGAAEVYLALAALYHAAADLDPRQRDPQLRAQLQAMSQALTFPGLKTVKYDSPEEQHYRSRDKQFQADLQKFGERLGR